MVGLPGGELRHVHADAASDAAPGTLVRRWCLTGPTSACGVMPGACAVGVRFSRQHLPGRDPRASAAVGSRTSKRQPSVVLTTLTCPWCASTDAAHDRQSQARTAGGVLQRRAAQRAAQRQDVLEDREADLRTAALSRQPPSRPHQQVPSGHLAGNTSEGNIMESAMPTVVLVHGAWNGPWAWDEVRRYLDLARIASATAALPSVGENTGKLGGLADDVSGRLGGAGRTIRTVRPGRTLIQWRAGHRGGCSSRRCHPRGLCERVRDSCRHEHARRSRRTAAQVVDLRRGR